MRRNSQSATSKRGWFLNPWWGNQFEHKEPGLRVAGLLFALSQVLTEIICAEMELKDQRRKFYSEIWKTAFQSHAIHEVARKVSTRTKTGSSLGALRSRNSGDDANLTVMTTTASATAAATAKELTRSINKNTFNSSYFWWDIILF